MSFADCGLGQGAGILFRYRQCNVCNRFLDEEIRQRERKKEIMSAARRGSFIIQQGAGFDDEGDYASQFAEDAENIRLYDCGHAFHFLCIKKYLTEQLG